MTILDLESILSLKVVDSSWSLCRTPIRCWNDNCTHEILSRLKKRRVWVVDPLDGTREFVDGIDEWCISVALVFDGEVIAAGICNPATDQLALVSAGLADATFTLVPKNEWDIAAGPFLVNIAGGRVADKQGRTLTFNRPRTLREGLVAAGPGLFGPLTEMLGITPQPHD